MMWKILVRLFIKDYDNVTNDKVRIAYGVLTGVVGIISNIFLAVFKIIIGFIIGSLAVIADGINNFSDTGTSIITFVGFRLSGAPADKDHPFGHQRIEYVTGLIIAFFIFSLGLYLAYVSVNKIINPTELIFSWLIIGMLAATVLIKVWQSYFYRKSGKKIKSNALKAAASDSRNDIYATSAIMVSGIVMMYFQVNLDGYMSLFVSLFIIYNGIQFIKQSGSLLIGEAADPGYKKEVLDMICKYEGVLGVHDLVIHQYGPAKKFITAHVEVDKNVDIIESHRLIDNIERDVSKNLNCSLVIHLDPVDQNCAATARYRVIVAKVLEEIDPILEFHDLRIVENPDVTDLIFDVVTPYKYALGDEELRRTIEGKLTKTHKGINLLITIDQDYLAKT